MRSQLASGADANLVESDGTSALLWATYHSSVELVKLLLDAGADPNRANVFGVTPLLQSSRNGDVDTVRALLAGGADSSQAVREGETPLMAAARSGNAEAVRVLLEHGADPNATETGENQTALMWATTEGHLEIVTLLLEAGADPNRQARVSELTKRSMRTDFASGGLSALMWAARNGNEAIVRRLVDSGADVNLTNGDGSTAMMLAIANDRFDMAATLLELGADANDGSLFYAVEMRDAPTDWRARDGSRLRADHPNRLTALDLIERLLAAGADPNKPYSGQMHSASMCCDTKGSATPFYRAAIAADVDAMRASDRRRRRRRNDAATGRRRSANAVRRLHGPHTADGGAQRGQRDADGGRPRRHSRKNHRYLPRAWQSQPSDAVKLLLEAGANPNALSSKGDTALHIAAHDGRLESIRELIAAGADTNIRNSAKLTALELVETMKPRTLNLIAEMVGLFDDGAQPKETAAFLRDAIAAAAAVPRR